MHALSIPYHGFLACRSRSIGKLSGMRKERKDLEFLFRIAQTLEKYFA